MGESGEKSWWEENVEDPHWKQRDAERAAIGDNPVGQIGHDISVGVEKGVYYGAKDMAVGLFAVAKWAVLIAAHDPATEKATNEAIIKGAKGAWKFAKDAYKADYGTPEERREVRERWAKSIKDLGGAISDKVKKDWDQASRDGKRAELVSHWTSRGVFEIAALFVGAGEAGAAAKASVAAKASEAVADLSKLEKIGAIAKECPVAAKAAEEAAEAARVARALEEAEKAAAAEKAERIARAQAAKAAAKKAEQELARKADTGDRAATYELNKAKARKANESAAKNLEQSKQAAEKGDKAAAKRYANAAKADKSSAKGYEAENKIADELGDDVVKAGQKVEYTTPDGKIVKTDIDLETKTEIVQIKSGGDMPSANQMAATLEHAKATGKKPVVVFNQDQTTKASLEHMKKTYPDVDFRGQTF